MIEDEQESMNSIKINDPICAPEQRLEQSLIAEDYSAMASLLRIDMFHERNNTANLQPL